MMAKRMNVVKLAIAGLMFSTNFLILTNATPQEVIVSKNISWGNVAKATILSTTSLAGMMMYYKSIIEPYVIKLARKKGLDYAIKFNKDFVLQNPKLAALYAAPLFLGIFHAVLAYDYAKKITTEDVQ
ncbi:MAG TPA: hypothetical protein VKU36_00965 [Candidatus Babeliales bacterium]|jgi:hypothetical protein|nr:hypothetical protein [Candidatus Babeliales bacterium]